MHRSTTTRSLLTALAFLLAMAVMPSSTALASPPNVPAPGDESAVTALLDDYYETRKEATAAVSVGYFDAQNATTKHYGFMDVENKVPAEADSVYEWGSVSKLLVWVAIMQLEEQGLLDRADPARDHLDGTELTFEQPFTIQDLMNH